MWQELRKLGLCSRSGLKSDSRASRGLRAFLEDLEALTSTSKDLSCLRALTPRTRNFLFMGQLRRNPGVSG